MTPATVAALTPGATRPGGAGYSRPTLMPASTASMRRDARRRRSPRHHAGPRAVPGSSSWPISPRPCGRRWPSRRCGASMAIGAVRGPRRMRTYLSQRLGESPFLKLSSASASFSVRIQSGPPCRLRVESRRGAVAWALWASLRFLSPLIKPDVRISRIRLPDRLHLKAHGGGPRWTRLCRITPSSPNATVSGKRLVPRDDTLWPVPPSP